MPFFYFSYPLGFLLYHFAKLFTLSAKFFLGRNWSATFAFVISAYTSLYSPSLFFPLFTGNSIFNSFFTASIISLTDQPLPLPKLKISDDLPLSRYESALKC